MSCILSKRCGTMFRVETEDGVVRVVDHNGNPVMFIRNNSNTEAAQGISPPRNVGGNLSPVVLLHEWKRCAKPEISQENMVNKITINGGVTEPEPSIDKESFLKLFNLTPHLISTNTTVTSISHQCPDDCKWRISRKGQLYSFSLTSAYGQHMIEKNNLSVNPSEISKHEKFCLPTKRRIGIEANLRELNTANYDVTYIPRREPSCHQYCFTRRQRVERLKTIRIGLNKRSRELKLQCRNLKVKVKRLEAEEIKSWTCRKRKPPEIIDILDSDDEVVVINSLSANSQTSTPIKATVEPSPASTNECHSNCHLSPFKNSSPLLLKNSLPSLINSASPSHRKNTSSPDQMRLTSALVKLRHLHNGVANGLLHKHHSSLQNYSSEKLTANDDDSDSDIEYLGCKVSEAPVKLAKPPPLQQRNSNNVIYIKSSLLNLFAPAKTKNIDGFLKHKTSYKLSSSTRFQCQICQHSEMCEDTSVMERLQEHMKMGHSGWQQIVAVHKIEFDHQQNHYVRVVEAYPNDHVNV